MTARYATRADALAAATRAARSAAWGWPYAFAVEWAVGHWTVELRKPLLRPGRGPDGRLLEVVECRASGEQVLA